MLRLNEFPCDFLSGSTRVTEMFHNRPLQDDSWQCSRSRLKISIEVCLAWRVNIPIGLPSCHLPSIWTWWIITSQLHTGTALPTLPIAVIMPLPQVRVLKFLVISWVKPRIPSVGSVPVLEDQYVLGYLNLDKWYVVHSPWCVYYLHV